LPSREEVLATLAYELGGQLSVSPRTTLHYLDGQVEVDLLIGHEHTLTATELAALAEQLQAIASKLDFIRDIRLHRSVA
ncbi:MAG: cation-efflux pump, partial [Planctomyces sp.]